MSKLELNSQSEAVHLKDLLLLKPRNLRQADSVMKLYDLPVAKLVDRFAQRQLRAKSRPK